MSRPKTAPQTLCEPAQSKRMSRFSYSVGWFMRETIAPKTMQAEIAYGVYRWLWHQAKRRHDKRRPEVERRETLCARLRASQSELRRRTAQNADIHVVRACAVKTQSRFHKSHFRRKITRKMPRPKTAPQTLCEPRQSKRMSRFSSVSWFMRETIAPKTMQAEIAYGVYRWLWHQAKRRRDKRRPEVERRETLCARLRASQNEPRRRTAQNADIHVVRACEVKTQSRFHKSHFIRKITRKMPRPKTAPQTLCEPGQSKRMSRFSYSVSWFMRETIAPKTMQAEIAYGVYRWLWHQAKRRRDKKRPEVERRETLCARLRASQ